MFFSGRMAKYFLYIHTIGIDKAIVKRGVGSILTNMGTLLDF